MFDTMRKTIENCERKAAKIAANPDNTKLKVNQLHYQLTADFLREQLYAYENGIPIGASSCQVGACLFPAMGCAYVNVSSMVEGMFWTSADTLLQDVVAMGYPERACERCTISIAAYKKGLVPKPSFAVTTNHACEWITRQITEIAEQCDIPLFPLDNPPTQRPEDVHYVEQQFHDMFEFLQRKVPGVKPFDPEIFEFWQGVQREARQNSKEMIKARMAVPSPVTSWEVHRLPVFDNYPRMLPSPEEAKKKYLHYSKAFRDEIVDRAERKFAAVPNERVRLMITPTAPNFGDINSFLDAQGAPIVYFHIGGGAVEIGYFPDKFDNEPHGWNLSPLEREARHDAVWGSMGDRWAESGVECARAFKVDGIINMRQSGCICTAGIERLLTERCKKELGIPTLFIDGRMYIKGDYDEEQWHTRLSDFIEHVVIPAKEERKARMAAS